MRASWRRDLRNGRLLYETNMSKATQISAFISESTKALLEEYTRATGVKKGHLVEEALLHHMRALKELPADVIVPARIVVSPVTGKRLVRLSASPARPTPALRDLLSE